MCNILLRAFHGLNNNIIISLYKVHVNVRSLLDYASVFYSPNYMYLIDFLKNVRRNLLTDYLVYVI